MARLKACVGVDSGLLVVGDSGVYSWTTSGNHLAELLLSWSAYERRRLEQNDRTMEFSLEELDARFREGPHGLRYMIMVASVLEKDFGISQKLVAKVHEIYRNMLGSSNHRGTDVQRMLQEKFAEACESFVKDKQRYLGIGVPAEARANAEETPASSNSNADSSAHEDLEEPNDCSSDKPDVAARTSAIEVPISDVHGGNSTQDNCHLGSKAPKHNINVEPRTTYEQGTVTTGWESRPQSRGGRRRKTMTNRDITYLDRHAGDPHPAVVALAEAVDEDGMIFKPEYITWSTLHNMGWSYKQGFEGTFYFVPKDKKWKELHPDTEFPKGHQDVKPCINLPLVKNIPCYNVFRELFQLREIVLELQTAVEK